MSKRHPVNSVLKKTAENWPGSNQGISPEILRIHRVHEYLHHNLCEVLVDFGLQAADFGALETLRKEPPPHCLSPTDLSSAMLFSSGGLTKVLNRLTHAGYIERLENPEDKRGKLVQLTDAGKELIERVIEVLHQQEREKMSVLSDAEKLELNKLLNKVLAVWE